MWFVRRFDWNLSWFWRIFHDFIDKWTGIVRSRLSIWTSETNVKKKWWSNKMKFASQRYCQVAKTTRLKAFWWRLKHQKKLHFWRLFLSSSFFSFFREIRCKEIYCKCSRFVLETEEWVCKSFTEIGYSWVEINIVWVGNVNISKGSISMHKWDFKEALKNRLKNIDKLKPSESDYPALSSPFSHQGQQ